jgi:hypothetical protein
VSSCQKYQRAIDSGVTSFFQPYPKKASAVLSDLSFFFFLGIIRVVQATCTLPPVPPCFTGASAAVAGESSVVRRTGIMVRICVSELCASLAVFSVNSEPFNEAEQLSQTNDRVPVTRT